MDRGGWRERKTVAWLIAISDRQQFRPRLGELLLASQVPYAGAAYCVALASFGTEADALILCDYLDRYLRRPDLDYDQVDAMGALLCVDAGLETSHHARLMEPGGLWQGWRVGVAAAILQARGFGKRAPAAVPNWDQAELQHGIARAIWFVLECASVVKTDAPPQQ